MCVTLNSLVPYLAWFTKTSILNGYYSLMKVPLSRCLGMLTAIMFKCGVLKTCMCLVNTFIMVKSESCGVCSCIYGDRLIFLLWEGHHMGCLPGHGVDLYGPIAGTVATIHHFPTWSCIPPPSHWSNKAQTFLETFPVTWICCGGPFSYPHASLISWISSLWHFTPQTVPCIVWRVFWLQNNKWRIVASLCAQSELVQLIFTCGGC